MAGLMVGVCLIFKGTAKLFSKVVGPSYFPAKKVMRAALVTHTLQHLVLPDFKILAILVSYYYPSN